MRLAPVLLCLIITVALWNCEKESVREPTATIENEVERVEVHRWLHKGFRDQLTNC